MQPHIYYLLAGLDGRLPPVNGIIFAVIQRPTIIRKTKRNKQTLEDYLAEIREWYTATGRHTDKAEERQKTPPVVMYPYALSSLAMPKWLTARVRAATKWLRVKEAALADVPPRELSCKFGGSVCSFSRLCNDECGGQWPQLIADHFTTAADPLDSNAAEGE